VQRRLLVEQEAWAVRPGLAEAEARVVPVALNFAAALQAPEGLSAALEVLFGHHRNRRKKDSSTGNQGNPLGKAEFNAHQTTSA
jgi:hypothetical protein